MLGNFSDRNALMIMFPEHVLVIVLLLLIHECIFGVEEMVIEKLGIIK
jgi:hypothetical protein